MKTTTTTKVLLLTGYGHGKRPHLNFCVRDDVVTALCVLGVAPGNTDETFAQAIAQLSTRLGVPLSPDLDVETAKLIRRAFSKFSGEPEPEEPSKKAPRRSTETAPPPLARAEFVGLWKATTRAFVTGSGRSTTELTCDDTLELFPTGDLELRTEAGHTFRGSWSWRGGKLTYRSRVAKTDRIELVGRELVLIRENEEHGGTVRTRYVKLG